MAGMYHVGRNGQQTGPFSVEQLKAMADAGELQPTDLVWQEGMAGWEPAGTLPGVFAAASSGGGTPQAAPAPLAQATVLPPIAGPGGPRQNGLALTGMILGIVSFFFLCCCYGLPFNVGGIVCSIMGMNQIKADPSQSGMGMAQAGLWCSIASLVIGAILLVLALVGNAFNWEEIIRNMENKG